MGTLVKVAQALHAPTRSTTETYYVLDGTQLITTFRCMFPYVTYEEMIFLAKQALNKLDYFVGSFTVIGHPSNTNAKFNLYYAPGELDRFSYLK